MLKKINPFLNKFLLLFLFLFYSNLSPQENRWYEKESEHFKIIYTNSHSYLVPHLLNSAENSFSVLTKIFNYEPTEKIIINTFDYYDYGFASATSVPQNYIRLEIEPFEPGYENVPYNERFQWVLTHELVHIIINDQAGGFESAFRKLFSKVAPEPQQPLTIPFSLLTNINRYTPRWHQEGIAVFFETWLSGGFGRILGNFDEMYFRSMVLKQENFPSDLRLETISSNKSFLLETLFYLYGARFSLYLSINYGPEKLIEWYKEKSSSFYGGFKNKFESVYNIDFDYAWENFIEYEKVFQKQNIARLKSAPLTTVKKIINKPIGWVSNPYYDINSNSIIFANHQPSYLAGIKKLYLSSGEITSLATLPTPSIYQVSSTAFNNKYGLFFYTTNNNQLYRDIWLLDIKTEKIKQLFKDMRIGNLSISQVTNELWGIQHNEAKSILVVSEYPYNTANSIYEFDIENEILQISVSPSGKNLAAVLHKSNGEQSIIIINLDELKTGKPLQFKTITKSGTPENPSWSPDEKFLFWNAYTNGVSNIYRTEIESNKIEALSHTLSGLFKPIYINSDSLFAFEFTSNGFIPVFISNKPAVKLNAIEYLGQKLLNEYPDLMNLTLKPYDAGLRTNIGNEEEYSGISNLNIQTFIPVVTGFQSQKAVGFFTRISDPLLLHDITMELGISPFNNIPNDSKYHVKFKYEYKKEFSLSVDYNATDFYDLVNKRKRGMMGTRVNLGHTHYWLYDNPHKIKQQTDITLYEGINFLNDNFIKVSQPDFIVANTVFNSKSLRKSIGSSDYEKGNDYSFTLTAFGSNPKTPNFSGQLSAEVSNFSTWIWRHNIFHLKLGTGYHIENKNIVQSQFYFGGFGNRYLENEEVKQYRNLYRFPGIPIYSLPSDYFGKILIENNFPPIRFSNIGIFDHLLNYIDYSIYSQTLYSKSIKGNFIGDVGTQINFIFKHWYNLESTFSAGIAQAWFEEGNSWEWFLSLKLLKN